MYWGTMQLSKAGKDVLKKRLEDINKMDIPVRFIRLRQIDGKEELYWKKQVIRTQCRKKIKCDSWGISSKTKHS